MWIITFQYFWVQATAKLFMWSSCPRTTLVGLSWEGGGKHGLQDDCLGGLQLISWEICPSDSWILSASWDVVCNRPHWSPSKPALLHSPHPSQSACRKLASILLWHSGVVSAPSCFLCCILCWQNWILDAYAFNREVLQDAPAVCKLLH